MLNSRDLSLLRPDVAANCRIWLELCGEAGLSVLITGTVRDEEYQMLCYRSGTSRARRPAFHAQGVGLAFDFCKNVRGHEYDDADFFRRAAEIAEKMGFEWGGRWRSFPDKPHLQWSGGGRYKSAHIWAGRLPPEMPLYRKEDDMDISKLSDEDVLALWERTMGLLAALEPAPWSAQGRAYVEAEGILGGDQSGRLMYKKPLTREEFAQIAYRQRRKGG